MTPMTKTSSSTPNTGNSRTRSPGTKYLKIKRLKLIWVPSLTLCQLTSFQQWYHVQHVEKFDCFCVFSSPDIYTDNVLNLPFWRWKSWITECDWNIMLHYVQMYISVHLLINEFPFRSAPQHVAFPFSWHVDLKDCKQSSSHTKTGRTGGSHSDAVWRSVALGWSCFHEGSFSLNLSHFLFLQFLVPKPLHSCWIEEQCYVTKQRNNKCCSSVE